MNEEQTENAIVREVAKTESRTPMGGLRLVSAVVVVILVAIGGFTTATLVTRNSQSITSNCREQNEALEKFNVKIAQLTQLFDEAIANPDPSNRPPSEEVLALYEEFRQPIPLVRCKP